MEKPFFSSLTIQPKLTVGQPGGKYKQEADAVADRVMSKESIISNNLLNNNNNNNNQTAQSKCPACSKEKVLQTKSDIKRQEGMEEEHVQAKPTMKTSDMDSIAPFLNNNC